MRGHTVDASANTTRATVRTIFADIGRDALQRHDSARASFLRGEEKATARVEKQRMSGAPRAVAEPCLEAASHRAHDIRGVGNGNGEGGVRTSAMRACSTFTTSMMTPPFIICASPRFTSTVPAGKPGAHSCQQAWRAGPPTIAPVDRPTPRGHACAAESRIARTRRNREASCAWGQRR